MGSNRQAAEWAKDVFSRLKGAIDRSWKKLEDVYAGLVTDEQSGKVDESEP